MNDARCKESRPRAGKQSLELSDEEMRALLREGQALSGQVTESFRKNVTIGGKELAFRFRYHPMRAV